VAILVVAGVIILLLQFGIGWGYLLRYGGPALLVLSGIYLLLQGTGVLKKYRRRPRPQPQPQKRD